MAQRTRGCDSSEIYHKSAIWRGVWLRDNINWNWANLKMRVDFLMNITLYKSGHLPAISIILQHSTVPFNVRFRKDL